MAEFPVRESLEIARVVERLGYHSFWVSEVNGSDALATLAALAATTKTLVLGSAVVPAFTRPLPLLAMSAATVQSLSNGRLQLGIGASTPTVVHQWMGLDYSNPVARVRNTISGLRSVLAGTRVDPAGNAETGRTQGAGFTLQRPQQLLPIPIFVGASGPRMREMAGSAADGVIASAFVRPSLLSHWLKPVLGALAATNLPRADFQVVTRTFVVEPAARPAARRLIAGAVDSYRRHPGYAAQFAEQGLLRRQASAAIDELLVDVGDIPELVGALSAGGADLVTIEPVLMDTTHVARSASARETLAAIASNLGYLPPEAADPERRTT